MKRLLMRLIAEPGGEHNVNGTVADPEGAVTRSVGPA